MYDKLVTGLESSNSVCSPVRVINKSDSRFAVVKFYCHEYDYTPNWTLLTLLFIALTMRHVCTSIYSNQLPHFAGIMIIHDNPAKPRT